MNNDNVINDNENVNLKMWNELKTPPDWALKKIEAGRLKGKSDINPQWRYMAMTQEFGPCGIGWKYTIDKLWTEPASEGQIMAFAQISLYINNNGWSESIPAIGGSMSIVKESKGLHSSDECYKMAVTDALGTAMKMIGVAATVYQGFNDSKYNVKKQQSETRKEKGNFQNCVNAMEKFKNLESLAKFYKGLNQFEWTTDEMNQIKSFYNTLKSNLLEVK